MLGIVGKDHVAVAEIEIELEEGTSAGLSDMAGIELTSEGERVIDRNGELNGNARHAVYQRPAESGNIRRDLAMALSANRERRDVRPLGRLARRGGALPPNDPFADFP